MATVPISDGDPKNSYTATAGQTTFAYTFWIKSSDHLAVYVNGTLKTLTTDYTVSAVQSVSGANVVFNSGLTEDDAVVIVYDPEFERTAEYTGTIRLDALNTELTYLLTLLQSNKRQIDDSLRPPDTETGSFSGALPALSGNGLKVLRLKSDLSGVEFGPTTTGLDALVALTTEIAALGAITSEIVAVEAVDAEIVTVAGLDTEIAALGPISANITTVAGNTTNINTVASDLAGSDTIGTVAGLATEVAALGAIATEIAAVEAVDAEIVTLAALSSQITALGAISTELTALGAITTEIVAVEAVDAEIAALAALTSELTTLGALSSEISALGAIATEIAAVEAVDAEIVTLAALDTEITALAALSTEITALGALTTEISAVAGITTEISAVYAALSTITDAASNIPKANRVATTDPTVTDDTSEGYSEGSQWVNTSTGAIFFLADATEGAAVWTSVAGSISGLSDTTISGVASGDILRYNGSVWTNQKYIDDMSAMGAFPAATTDYIPIYDTSATTEYKITPANFFKNIFGLTTDASPDAAADYVLTYDTSAASAKKILLNQVTNLADDSTPQLGGNLDVNGKSIVSASNGDIPITPNGTGKVILDGLTWPTADGSAGQLLKTDGAGNLSFVDAASGGAWTEISRQTVSSAVSSVDFTGLDDTYDLYKLVILGANGSNGSSGNEQVALRLRLESGSTWITSGYDVGMLRVESAIPSGLQNTYTSGYLASALKSTDAEGGVDSVVYFSNLRDTSVNSRFLHQTSVVWGGAERYYAGMVTANNANAIDGIRALLAGGSNWVQGTFILFGA